MRTKLYSLMAWIACLTMASCTNQEIIEQAIKPVHSNTLNVLTEKQESRSVLSYEGTFYWTENDYIGVYGTETENARFHFTSQADGVSTFTGNLNASEEKVSWAYFPYSEKMDVNKKQLSFPMPAERTISNENHSPMIGRVEANNTVRFYHTGGILYLKIVGLPEHAAQLVITSEGENSPCLAGTAVIDDIMADGCTYRIDNGSKEVVYDVRNLEGGEYVYSVYMPLQVGTYEKIKVTLKNEVGGIIKERSLSNLIVTRGKMTETPMLNFSAILYGYELSNKWLEESDWDDGILFSNELFSLYDSKNNRYAYFDLLSGENNNNPSSLFVYLDSENRVSTVISEDFVIYCNNYTDTTVDFSIMYDGKIYNFNNQSLLTVLESRAEISRDHWTRTSAIVCKVVDLGLMLSPIPGGNRATGVLSSMGFFIDNTNVQIVSSLTTHFLGFAALASLGATPLGVVVGFGLMGYGIYSLYNTFAVESEEKFIEKQFDLLYGTMLELLLIEQPNDSYKVGYQLINTANIPKELKVGFHESGLLIAREKMGAFFNEGSLRYTNKKGVEKILVTKDFSSDRSIFDIIECERGFTYYIRGYIAINVNNSNNPVCYYSDIEKISFEDFRILEKTISDAEYLNGKFKFKVKAKAECYTGKNWSLAIYKNDEKNRDKDFSPNTQQETEFDVEVSKKSMDYSTKKAIDKWELALCTVPIYGENGYSVKDYSPTVKEILELAYDVEPSIDLNVKIMDGYPRKINNSRASDDDDEEKWIVKYQVTAETKGSGWIEQVRIYEQDKNKVNHYMKTGQPKNEGDSFTYTGSKTYKDKSELPTILCDVILINGAGNKQSVPASINIASKL